MDRRDRHRPLEAERPELGGLELAPGVVALVDCEDDRGAGLAQQVRGLEVGRRRTGDRVDDEQDHVGLGDREAGLDLDGSLDRVVRVDLEAAGVHDEEAAAVPVAVAVQPVPRRARPVLHDRGPLADDPVEERRLPDVRTTDDRDDRNAA